MPNRTAIHAPHHGRPLYGPHVQEPTVCGHDRLLSGLGNNQNRPSNQGPYGSIWQLHCQQKLERLRVTITVLSRLKRTPFDKSRNVGLWPSVSHVLHPVIIHSCLSRSVAGPRVTMTASIW